MQQFIRILNSAYQQINTDGNTIDSNVYFTIIQIKKDNPSLGNYEQSIYKDIKLFITAYLESTHQEDFGYDFIDLDKLHYAIDAEQTNRARYQLCYFCARALKSSNHEELAESILKRAKKFQILIEFEKKGFLNYWKALLILSAYNFFTIFLTIIFLSLFTLILVQDAPIEWFELFSFEYEQFSPNKLFNAFLNIWAKPFGLAENFKVIPLNVRGIIILILLKILYIVFIVNYLLEKTKEVIKL
ncbi:hypothetical protein [Flavobacterium terrae]|uniref:Uncharacterized protein n=1 Tax=Flavobacterium terrae TaxID=415425 RepID=A0A1M6HFB9_9FLAO|nr:hypothetical protein [Flavobacterium terrae]SHJ20918.1 hypothetical protein SAMN05444363_3003 [Flavobacterium terrae]